MQKLATIDVIALILLVIGGLNWGIIGISHTNVIDMIFESMPIIATVIYVLVGLSAIYVAWLWTQLEKK